MPPFIKIKDKSVIASPVDLEKIALIKDAVCEYFSITAETLIKEKNNTSVAHARHIFGFFIIQNVDLNTADLSRLSCISYDMLRWGADKIDGLKTVRIELQRTLTNIAQICNKYPKKYEWLIL